MEESTLETRGWKGQWLVCVEKVIRMKHNLAEVPKEEGMRNKQWQDITTPADTQRWNNVDQFWVNVNIESTLFQRCLPTGTTLGQL